MVVSVIEVTPDISLEGIIDAAAKSVEVRAEEYFGIKLSNAKQYQRYVIDADLSAEEIKLVKEKVFDKNSRLTSLDKPLSKTDFDYAIAVSFKPGVKDEEGEMAKEAIVDLLGKELKANEGIYYSTLITFNGELPKEELDKIASGLLANENIQEWAIMTKEAWDPVKGAELRIPKVDLHEPTFKYYDLNTSWREFQKLNDEHNWAIQESTFEHIKKFFYSNSEFAEKRKELEMQIHPTDVEIERLAQYFSDHCLHLSVKGKYAYKDLGTGKAEVLDDLFEGFIKDPTEELAKENEWIVSVLEDNAGAMYLDKDGRYLFVIKGETHNSPSNKEGYGGAYTGIAGIFRDIFGWGRGANDTFGMYFFCTGPRDYNGFLVPTLHPKRLQDDVIRGVRDGGNKHGIPTLFGGLMEHSGYIGKSLVYVITGGISPREIAGTPAEKKWINPGDLCIIYGGRTGIDGIHGVTEASLGQSARITMKHVQKGDSYLQRKVSELLMDATHEGLINFSWDLGGGGQSSATNESSAFAKLVEVKGKTVGREEGGIRLYLERTRLKYQGLDLWQIEVSESQERMLAAISPENLERLAQLARLHDVEITVAGEYTESNAVHSSYNDQNCCYLPREIFKTVPQWKFKATWIPPELRLTEPVISDPKDHNAVLEKMLARPNIASKEWITRQYDHEVKGGTVIKPIVGVKEDVHSPAVVQRPILEERFGIALTQSLHPHYGQIDTYWMTLNSIDESLRRVAAVSGMHFKPNGMLERVGALDNFCWPEITPGKTNPDAEYKAAQLVRAHKALQYAVKTLGLPLLSGKDSMYCNGLIPGSDGETHGVSAPATLNVTVASAIDDVDKCVTMDAKIAGDLVYVIGETKNELGGSEFYDMYKNVGLNVPKVNLVSLKRNLMAVAQAVDEEIVASAQPVMRGGLGVHLAEVAFAGCLGMDVDLSKLPYEGLTKNIQALYSESASRFIVTVDPRNKDRFEQILQGKSCTYACLGTITQEPTLKIKGLEGKEIINQNIEALRQSYKSRYGALI
jgi:phosphoribosylformylglycinamidine synthase